MADNALSTEQVATLLQVSSATVRRVARRGDLAAFTVGQRGQLRFSPADVRRYIDRQRVRTSAGATRPHPDTAGLIHLGDEATAAGAVRLTTPLALAGESLEVDAKAGIVRNVSIITAGPAVGHGFTIDGVMLRQVADQINSAGGVRCRLTHAGGGDDVDALVGRVRNARVDGQRVRGDLHIGQYAATSPAGDLRAYVLGIASEDPELAGLSIVFDPDTFASDGAGKLLGRSKQVIAADLVGSPAANRRGMLSFPPQGNAMPTPTPNVPATPDSPAAPAALSTPAVPDAAVMLERERVQAIYQLSVAFPDLPATFVAEHTRLGSTCEQANRAALVALRETRRPVTAVSVRNCPTQDSTAALTDALAIRFGAKIDKPSAQALSFRGLSPIEMARRHADNLGINTAGMSRDQLVRSLWTPADMQRAGAVALYQGAGNFPAILADAMNKTARIGYGLARRTWDRWARKATAPDFKTIHRPQLSDIVVPPVKHASGEYKHVTLGDSEETYVLVEYGEIVALTRRAIVNDDLSAFDAIPRKLVAVARQLEDDVAYAQLVGNPVMAEDEVQLFHATHGNLAEASGDVGPPTIALIGAGRARMGRQTGPKGNVFNLEATVVLVPLELLTETEQLVASLVDPTKGNNAPNAEFVRNLSVVGDARLSVASETAWYLAAATEQIDGVEVAFLEGEESPVVETDTSFETDALRVKVRHTVAAKALDFRAFDKNNGA